MDFFNTLLAGALAGGLLLGPLGAIGGMLVSGNSKKVVFIANFTDGKQALVQTDADTFTRIQADIFNGPVTKSKSGGLDITEQFILSIGIVLGFCSIFWLNKYLWVIFAVPAAAVIGFIAGFIGLIIYWESNRKNNS